MFVEITEEKLVKGTFLPLPPHTPTRIEDAKEDARSFKIIFPKIINFID